MLECSVFHVFISQRRGTVVLCSVIYENVWLIVKIKGKSVMTLVVYLHASGCYFIQLDPDTANHNRQWSAPEKECEKWCDWINHKHLEVTQQLCRAIAQTEVLSDLDLSCKQKSADSQRFLRFCFSVTLPLLRIKHLWVSIKPNKSKMCFFVFCFGWGFFAIVF